MNATLGETSKERGRNGTRQAMNNEGQEEGRVAIRGKKKQERDIHARAKDDDGQSIVGSYGSKVGERVRPYW